MVCPKIRIKLKISQIVRNKNVTIENGRNALSFVCSLFFIIKTPPNDTRTSPNSSGWWDQDINPSIPKRSWDKESAKPESNWTTVPTITSIIPVLRDLWTDFLNKRMQLMNAAQLVIDTPE